MFSQVAGDRDIFPQVHDVGAEFLGRVDDDIGRVGTQADGFKNLDIGDQRLGGVDAAPGQRFGLAVQMGRLQRTSGMGFGVEDAPEDF